MTRAMTCVECRHLDQCIDPRKTTRRGAAPKRRLPRGAAAPGACGKFELPEAAAHWGP